MYGCPYKARRKRSCRGSARRGEIPLCYWAIAHSGSKIAVQLSIDNVLMHIIAVRTERGGSAQLLASSGVAEEPRLWNASTIITFN
jgi:hypothetical protein